MDRLICLTALFLILALPAKAHFFEALFFSTDPTPAPEYVEEEVRARLSEMPCLVSTRYDRVVEGYITGYVVRHRERTEEILGRTVMYFPLFEEYLRQHNLPEELNTSPWLNPRSTRKPYRVLALPAYGSFMEETGKDYGLTINSQVDERSDPVLSTLAAIEYLKKQYDRFGSWALALAAYNSGPGRVNRAIRRSGSKNFWRLRRYLPRETRNYVPAFIAATYLCLHYESHQMRPQLPELDLLLTDRIRVFEYLPFHRISQVTGLPLAQIEALNPSYQLGYLPTNRQGNILILPKRVMPAIVDYLRLKEADMIPRGVRWERVLTFSPVGYDPNRFYHESTYTVQEDDSLEYLADLFGYPEDLILAWNSDRLVSTELQPGLQLRLFHPRNILRFEARIEHPVEQIAGVTLSIPAIPPEYDPSAFAWPLETTRNFLIYRTNGGETLRSLSMLHQRDLNSLVENNPRIDPDEVLPEGKKIRLERF